MVVRPKFSRTCTILVPQSPNYMWISIEKIRSEYLSHNMKRNLIFYSTKSVHRHIGKKYLSGAQFFLLKNSCSGMLQIRANSLSSQYEMIHCVSVYCTRDNSSRGLRVSLTYKPIHICLIVFDLRDVVQDYTKVCLNMSQH